MDVNDEDKHSAFVEARFVNDLVAAVDSVIQPMEQSMVNYDFVDQALRKGILSALSVSLTYRGLLRAKAARQKR